MKLSNKFFFGALIAASIALVGCGNEAIGEDSIIKANGYTATIDYTNDTDAMVRAVKPVKFEHTQSLCRIKVDNVEAAKKSVIGYVFDKHTKNNVSGMYVVGLRVNNGNVEYYLSFFDEVTSEQLAENQSSFGTEYGFNGTDWVADDSNTKDIWELKGTSADYTALTQAATSKLVKNNKLDCYVGVMYDEETKEFMVGIFEATEALAKITKVDKLTDDQNKALEAAFVAGGSVLAKDPENVKGEIGFYANVVTAATLTGSWDNTARRAHEVVEE